MIVRVLNKSFEVIAQLKNVYNLILEDELIRDNQGKEILEFDIPFENSQDVDVERYIEVDNRIFVIKVITDVKGKQYSKHVVAEALWYELIDKLVEPIVFENETAQNILESLLEGSGWIVDTVENTETRNFEIKETISLLEAVNQVRNTFGGFIVFDTKNKKLVYTKPYHKKRHITTNLVRISLK